MQLDQIISQDASELGAFRGEAVYSRREFLQLKTGESWTRSERVVRAGEQPTKHVKQHKGSGQRLWVARLLRHERFYRERVTLESLRICTRIAGLGARTKGYTEPHLYSDSRK